MRGKKGKIRFVIFLAIIIISVIIVLFAGILHYNVESVKNLISNYYSISIIIYVVLIAIAAATTLPITVTLIAGILLFSFWAALFYAFLGVYLGALVMYLFSRLTGRGILENYAKGRKLKALTKLIHGDKFGIVLLLNLVYFFPSNLAHIIAGITKLDFWKFSLATIIGNYPNVFAVALLTQGALIISARYIILSVIILTLVTAIPLYIYRRHMRDMLLLGFSYKTYLKIKKIEKKFKEEENLLMGGLDKF